MGGARTTADFWVKNFEKTLGHLLPAEMQNMFKELIAMISKLRVFETDFESYFDTQPPFQLSEAILTGSLSEGLFLYSIEPPDIDFMCVLKNITFSKEDQEDGSSRAQGDN
jgi:hypothetical protein